MGLMNDSDREGLYKEYAEAGALCRSYEAHARTSMVLFVPFAVATIAFIFGISESPKANLVLSILGVIFSAATLAVLYRTREFNSIAHDRTLELEQELGFAVFTRLKARFADNWWLPSIKVTYMAVVSCFLAVFAWALGLACLALKGT